MDAWCRWHGGSDEVADNGSSAIERRPATARSRMTAKRRATELQPADGGSLGDVRRASCRARLARKEAGARGCSRGNAMADNGGGAKDGGLWTDDRGRSGSGAASTEMAGNGAVRCGMGLASSAMTPTNKQWRASCEAQ
ncbi:hypothetical protein Scep_005938 [Stephania cephalantha]|uniref:Uncharacterized protein n=1 Tax=Stephania cephalantha TaxID=152367 RepID=A0AAP0KWZ2_9MAGN